MKISFEDIINFHQKPNFLIFRKTKYTNNDKIEVKYFTNTIYNIYCKYGYSTKSRFVAKCHFKI